jgi:hypothetical protein
LQSTLTIHYSDNAVPKLWKRRDPRASYSFTIVSILTFVIEQIETFDALAADLRVK